MRPAEVWRQGDTTFISGHLTHYYRFRPNDQVFFMIVKRNGIVDKEKTLVRVGSGGFSQIAAPIVSAVGGYFGAPLPEDKIEEVGIKLGEIVDENWRTALDVIIASLSMTPAVHDVASRDDGCPHGIRHGIDWHGKASSTAKDVRNLNAISAVANFRIRSLAIEIQAKDGFFSGMQSSVE